ncbi:MAG: hypothetical protein HND57_15140 [Planctomycetes bacterium]|nr:hypothetical protein [Planctomycetota bacterium]
MTASTPLTAQTVWYVDDDAPRDPGPGDPTVSDPDEDGSKGHPFDAIQEAFDVASNGDTVLVRDGTYSGEGNHDVYFESLHLTVRSENGPETCTIDLERLGRAFFMDQETSTGSIIDGFTITNGFVENSNGGAIDCTLFASPIIRNCRFIGNEAQGLGGGVACRGGSSGLIENCLFEDNTCFGAVEGSQGGGLSCFFNANPAVINCTFLNNSSQHGGAIDCSLSNATFINCVIAYNHATRDGGGIFISVADPTFINCTVARNTAQTVGGGVVLAGAVLPAYGTFLNCILWEDSPNEIEVLIGKASVRYSNVQGGWSGMGNIDSNPRFVNPGGDDFSIAANSPCIDAGINNSLSTDPYDYDRDHNRTEAFPLDAADRQRFIDDPAVPDTGSGSAPLTDIGAYEYQLGLLLDNPDPGLPGQSNRVTAQGAPSNSRVYFVYGVERGGTSIPGCGGDLSLLIEDARLIDSAQADSNGTAFIDVFVPGRAAGRTVYFQAVVKSACHMTNNIQYTFPE